MNFPKKLIFLMVMQMSNYARNYAAFAANGNPAMTDKLRKEMK